MAFITIIADSIHATLPIPINSFSNATIVIVIFTSSMACLMDLHYHHISGMSHLPAYMAPVTW